MSQSSGTAPRPADRPNPVTAFLARRWLALVLLVLVAVFIGQNRATVSLDLFWLSVRAPQWFVLALVLLVGIIVGWVFKGRQAKASRAAKAAKAQR
ncbi:LapA family protein [Cellulomonas hominis]